MNVGLIDSNTYCDWIGGRYFVPLGLLSIAAIAEDLGHKVQLIQLSENISSDPAVLSRLIIEKSFDVVGFNTRSDTLPLVIEVVRRHKLRRKDIPIVLGGPGANFVDQDIIAAFPFIDVIVRGEGERTFAELLSALEHHDDLSDTDGITFKRARGDIIRTPNRTPIKDLNSLPELAFHLVEDKLNRPEVVSADILVGRGCPNHCSFCSTCAFWGKAVRMRSPEKVVAEMKMLNKKYGINSFALVHDNVFSQKTFVRDFCKLIRKDLPKATFGLSASLNFSSREIVRMVARSGCTNVFMGIETASYNLASNISRKYSSPLNVCKTLNLFRKYNIKATKSYILGFPKENRDDVNRTLALAIELQASASFRLLENTQIHPLTISPGTKLYKEYGDRLSYTRIIGDFSESRVVEIESCLDMCKRYPHIFTPYASYRKDSDFAETIELCNFYRILTFVCPKSTFIALRELELSPLEFLKHFKNHALTCGFDPEHLRDRIVFCKPIRFSLLRDLLQIFPEVLVKLYQDTNRSQDFVQLFWDCEQPRVNTIFGQYEYFNSSLGKFLHNDSLFELIPIIPRTTASFSLTYDPDKLFSDFYLRGKRTIPSTCRKIYIVYYLQRWVAVNGQKKLSFGVMKMDKLWKRVAPYIMQFVDGERSCLQIVDEIGSSLGFSKTPSLLSRKIQKILRLLIQRGVLMLSGELSEGSTRIP